MKVPTYVRRTILGAAGLVLLATTACLPDRMAWNPAGDRLTHIHADGSLWAWSPGGTPAKELYRDPKGTVIACFDPGLPSGALFVGVERPKSQPTDNPLRDLRLVQPGGAARTIVEDFSAEAGMTAQADGRRAWFLKENKPASRWEMWELDPTAAAPAPKLVYHQKAGCAYPSVSPDGRKVLLTFDGAIGVFDTDTATTKSLVNKLDDISIPIYSVWALGGESVAYIQAHPKVNDPKAASDLGDLCVFDVAAGKSRTLQPGISILRRPMVDSAGRFAYVTRAALPAGKPQPEMDNIAPKEIQIAAVDLKTGEMTILTREPEGAYWPVPDPKGDRIAYATYHPGHKGDGPEAQIVKLLDRKTGKTETLVP